MKWSHIRALSGRTRFVPEAKGVYAFCRVRRASEMPFHVEVSYVGKATNLRRRFREHLSPLTEHNLELFNALQESNIEFWYAEAPEIDDLEKYLIAEIDPPFNQREG